MHVYIYIYKDINGVQGRGWTWKAIEADERSARTEWILESVCRFYV